jgi:hypothetical protein
MTLFLILLQAAVALIASPAPGDTLIGTAILRGTAASPQFERYEIAFAYDPNPTDTWFEIQPASTGQVIDGVLAEWDTRLIADGNYMIRLRVFSSGSNTPAETIVRNIQVRNIAPTEPPPTRPAGATDTGVPTAAATPARPGTPEPGASTATRPSPTDAGIQPTGTSVEPTGTGVQLNTPTAAAPLPPFLDLSTYSSAFCNGVYLTFFAFVLLGTYVALRDRIRRLVRRWIRRILSDIRKP